jgi:hypothetical protein
VGGPSNYLHYNTPFSHGLYVYWADGGLWELVGGASSCLHNKTPFLLGFYVYWGDLGDYGNIWAGLLVYLQDSIFTWIICLLGDFRNHGNLWVGFQAICIMRLHCYLDYMGGPSSYLHNKTPFTWIMHLWSMGGSWEFIGGPSYYCTASLLFTCAFILGSEAYFVLILHSKCSYYVD